MLGILIFLAICYGLFWLAVNLTDMLSGGYNSPLPDKTMGECSICKKHKPLDMHKFCSECTARARASWDAEHADCLTHDGCHCHD